MDFQEDKLAFQVKTKNCEPLRLLMASSFVISHFPPLCLRLSLRKAGVKKEEQ